RRRDPPGPPPSPYTTLFRSQRRAVEQAEGDAVAAALVDCGKGRDDLARLAQRRRHRAQLLIEVGEVEPHFDHQDVLAGADVLTQDRKSTRLNSSHQIISYVV